MKAETRKTIEAFVRAAVTDPDERDAALKAIATPPERRDRPLKTKEACALAGISARTLQVWANEGKIHPIRATRSHVRYSRNELESFLGYRLEA